MSVDYAKLLDSIKGLITDSTTPEEAEKIANISKEVEASKTEYENVLIQHEELRQKYVKSLQQSVFGKKPEEVNPQPQSKSFEDCVNEVIAKRNKQ